ncbi:MAG: hypothetical protein PVJ86_12820 [Phycisphaerales bacterium]
MPTDKLSEDNFDKILGRAMRSSSESVPADFTRRMLKRIREGEEQKMLARVVLQERLALAGCIVLVVAAAIAIVVFPDAIAEVFRSAAGGFTEQGRAFVDRIPQAIEVVQGQWQFYTVLTAVVGFAVYSLVGLLVGDKLRMA